MFEIYFVTNRKLCKENFLLRLERLAAAKPKGIILREKDLTASEYRALAEKALQICGKQGTACILHTFYKVAAELRAPCLHLPMPFLRTLSGGERRMFTELGASCHSAAEAIEAAEAGCTYVTAGHVFETDCKKGVPPRGLEFLREICKSVKIPVLAIGGIHRENFPAVQAAGAQGACLMSEAMTCADPSVFSDNEY